MSDMELKPLPGTDGYFVDCERQEAYSFQHGMLRKLKPRTKYKKITLTIGGQTVGSTIYRMMYAAQHSIDIRRIPSTLCVTMTEGGVALVDRSTVSEKARKERWRGRTLYEHVKKGISMIDQFYEGETLPLLQYLQNIERKIADKLVFEHGLSEERAQIIAAYGVNKYLDRLKDGSPTPLIYTSVLRYAKGENARISKQNTLIEVWQKHVTAR